MAPQILIPTRRSSAMYQTNPHLLTKPAPPQPPPPPAYSSNNTMRPSTSTNSSVGLPILTSKSTRRPSTTDAVTTPATPPATTADSLHKSVDDPIAVHLPPAEDIPDATKTEAAHPSLDLPLSNGSISSSQRHTFSAPATPPTNRRLAVVRSSSSLASDRASSITSSSSSSLKATAGYSSISNHPKRPPLTSVHSSPNLSQRSLSPRHIPPQSDPPMYATPPTPDRKSLKSQLDSPIRGEPPGSPRSAKSLSVLPKKGPKSERRLDEDTSHVKIISVPSHAASFQEHPSEPTTSMSLVHGSQGTSPASGPLSPRFGPSHGSVLLSSELPMRAAAALDPWTSTGYSLAHSTGGHVASSDIERSSDSSLLVSPSPQVSLRRGSNSSLLSQVPMSPPTVSGERRGSAASGSSTSTFRVRRKPTPSELGDDSVITSSSSDARMVLDSRRGSVGSMGSRHHVSNSTNLQRPLHSLAEAQTPTIIDSKFDFPSTLSAPSLTLSMADTVMVDGQAFVLGDESQMPSRLLASGEADLSHDSQLSQRHALTAHAPDYQAKGSAARQEAIARSMARSISLGDGRSSDGAPKSASGRAKGLGDGNGFARRPGSKGRDGTADYTRAVTSVDGTKRLPSLPGDDTDDPAMEDIDTESGEGATAGSYAIDPPSKEALALAASLTVYSEMGDIQKFGDLFADRRTLVCFLRHWFCPMCQEYAMSMANLDPLPLQRANLGLIVVGQGHPHVLAAYKRVMGVPDWISMYADPTRKIYQALGMTKRTNNPGPACAKPDYITMSMTKGSMQAIKKGLFQMPIRLPGDTKLLGGEFILGPGLQSSFVHRMVTTRGHFDVPRILAQAGCDLSLKTPVAAEKESKQPSSTRSLGRSATRRRATHNVRRIADHYDQRGKTRSVSTPAGKRKDGAEMKRKISRSVPAVPKLPLGALFATGLDGAPVRRNFTDSSLSSGQRQRGTHSLDHGPNVHSLDTEVNRNPSIRRRPATADDRGLAADEAALPEKAQDQIREQQRRMFAAGPSNNPAPSGADRLQRPSVEQLRRSFERTATLNRSTIGRTPSQSRSRPQAVTIDSAFVMTPSSSNTQSITPASRRTQFVTHRSEQDESFYRTPLSQLPLHSDSPLLQDLRRSLSRHEPSRGGLDDEDQDGEGPKLVRQITQSRRPEVVTPVQIPEASAAIPGGGDLTPEQAVTTTKYLGHPTALGGDGGSSSSQTNGLKRMVSHRQLRLEGGAPSIRSVDSPPTTPRSAALALRKDSPRKPTWPLSPTLPAKDGLQEQQDESLDSTYSAIGRATAPLSAAGESAHVGVWDAEGGSADSSIADQLTAHETVLRRGRSNGSLASSRLSSPNKSALELRTRGANQAQRTPGNYKGVAASPDFDVADRAFYTPGLMPAPGGGASFLGELDMIDTFASHRLVGSDQVDVDGMSRYSFESSTRGDEETEPAESDSDVEHESGWVRPQSGLSSRGHRGTAGSLRGQSRNRSLPRASEDSTFSRGGSSLSSSDDPSPARRQQFGLSALSDREQDKDTGNDGEGEDDWDDVAQRGEDSSRTSSTGRPSNPDLRGSQSAREGERDDDDWDSDEDEVKARTDGAVASPSARSEATTPHNNGHLDALEEDEEEEEGEVTEDGGGVTPRFTSSHGEHPAVDREM